MAIAERVSGPPSAEYGCYDCDLHTIQDDLIFWLIVLSPFVLTVLIGIFFVRRATRPIGLLHLMLISVPGALPAAIGLAFAFEDEMASVVTMAILAVFVWTATFGPLVVFITQWIYLEVQRFNRPRKE